MTLGRDDDSSGSGSGPVAGACVGLIRGSGSLGTHNKGRMYKTAQLSVKDSANVAVKWIALQLHIRELPGSNFGPESGYPN